MTNLDENNGGKLDDRKEAVKTFIDQTKLLVTLSSAFVVAPAAFATLLKDRATLEIASKQMKLFLAAEALFVLSVLAGYVVLATISGYQHIGRYDVHRRGTRYASLAQIATYIAGMILFTLFILSIVRQ